LQALCGDLELAADHGHWPQVDAAMPQLRACWNRSGATSTL
jgi:hypothetical protein